jgi:hypothetical protein
MAPDSDLLGETLLTYIHGPGGEAGLYETYEPFEDGRGDELSAVLVQGADGKLTRMRPAYVVRFRESVRDVYFSLGEAYLAAGSLVGVESGIGHNPGQYLAD